MTAIKSRIAPTPSGLLHLGNLCAFVRTWLAVRRQKGSLLLRIDDIDSERSRPEYLADIFAWLQLLGIDYDDGPRSVADFEQHWSQQLRLPLYNHLLQRLADSGAVYACQCSRKQIAEFSADGKYHGQCRTKQLPLDTPDAVWRLHIPEVSRVSWHDEFMGHGVYFPAALLGDFIVRRKNGLPAYQVASLADDLHFGINYIVRGEDLLPSTAAQLYMAHLLGENDFLQATFAHHPLIKDKLGNKLSKSAGSGALLKNQQLKDPFEAWEMLQANCDVVPKGIAIQSIHDLL